MGSKITFVEKCFRLSFVFVILTTTIAPIPVAASPESKQTVQLSSEETPNPELFPLTSLPSQEKLIETPPYPEPDLSNRRTSPEPDKAEKILPPERKKEAIEFTLKSSYVDVSFDETIIFTARIVNNTEENLENLVYTDELEAGFGFVQRASSLVDFDSDSNTVTRAIPFLAAGEILEIDYEVRIFNDTGEDINHSRVWVHFAELDVPGEPTSLKAKTFLRITQEKTQPSQANYVDKAGGWVDLTDAAIYFSAGAIEAQGIVYSSPDKKPGKGPERQFSLELVETDVFEKKNGKLKEQKVDVKQQWKGTFLSPTFLEVSFDEITDLSDLPAGKVPYVATYDENNEIWVKVPILAIDTNTNKVIVKAEHFSTWGAGLGESLPQNGANLLLFDQPYTSLFTGSSRYSIPIWTPPGRLGMQPSIALSYSSATVDGVLGDVQAPWVGAGWNIDGIEIVRKITTDENGYGYENDFSLTLNGVMYELIRDETDPTRYYTERGSFLYIERHNIVLGNEESVSNATGEWWEVVSTDGTRYRLGWNEDSEQLALMYGYACTTGSPCNTPEGAYAQLGYAGIAEDLIAMRWRVDRIEDIQGNYLSYTYEEVQPDPNSLVPPFDRENYLETISYTGFSGTPSEDPGYQVIFVRETVTFQN